MFANVTGGESRGDCIHSSLVCESCVFLSLCDVMFCGRWVGGGTSDILGEVQMMCPETAESRGDCVHSSFVCKF